MTDKRTENLTTRRTVLAGAGSLAGAGLASGFGFAAISVTQAQIQASPAALALAIHKIAGEAPVKPGKVKLDMPPLSENGNSVSVTVTVDSPMTRASHVKAIHVVTEKNPQPYVISARLGPRAGQANISTRMRLSDTQMVVAIAELSDGSFWSDSKTVIVTLGACLEDLI